MTGDPVESWGRSGSMEARKAGEGLPSASAGEPLLFAMAESEESKRDEKMILTVEVSLIIILHNTFIEISENLHLHTASNSEDIRLQIL